MNVTTSQRIMLYQWAAGLCDTSTGLLLLAAPVYTLRLMGLHVIPEPVVFVRYIGVFVLSVGLSYLWAALAWPLVRRGQNSWSTQWKITALVRTLVALFIIAQVAFSAMESRWITVAFSDGVFAMIQWVGLRKGWLDRVS